MTSSIVDHYADKDGKKVGGVTGPDDPRVESGEVKAVYKKQIDGFGTILESITKGDSRRLDETGAVAITGSYTTVSQNTVYGFREAR